MPYFLLTFGDASRPPVGAVIIEAPSMFRARITAVVRRLAPDVPFGEGFELSAEMMMTIPSEEISVIANDHPPRYPKLCKRDRRPKQSRQLRRLGVGPCRRGEQRVRKVLAGP